MPQTVTPIGTWPSSFSAHADGDLVDGAGWLARIQDYANALQYLKDKANGLSVNDRVYCPFIAPGQSAGALRFAWNGVGQNQIDVTSAGRLDFDLPLPKGATTIQGIVLILQGGAGGAHTALPATLPTLELYRFPEAGGAPVSVSGPHADLSATFAAYDAAHVISASALAHAIVAQNRYIMKVTGETGAGSGAGKLQLIAAYATVDP